MHRLLTWWQDHWRFAWIRTVMYAALMFVLPEYCAPVLAVLALVAAHKDARSRDSSLCVGSFMRPLALYVVYMLIGLIYAIDRFSTVTSVAMWCVSLMFYVALVTVLTDRKRLSAAMAYLSFGLAINGLVACVQHFLKVNVGLSVDMQLWKWLDRLLMPLGYPGFPDIESRAAAAFTNPNILAEFFILFLPFVFYYLSVKTNVKRTVITRVGAVLTVFGLLFTFCRGAYLAMILIVALFLAVNIRKAPFLLFIALAVLVLIPSSVYSRLFSLAGSGEYVSGVVDQVEDDPTDGDTLLDDFIANAEKPTEDGKKPSKSLSERMQVWAASVDAILKRPLFGYGSGGMGIKGLLESYDVVPPHAHNLVLQLLLEGGVLGLSLWLAIAFSSIRKGYRLLLRSANPPCGMAVVAFVCGFCTISMTDYPFLSPKLVSGVLLVLALIDVFYQLFVSDEKRCSLREALIPRFR